jgi:E3 ubiquitin-protein ligase TRIP12
LDVEIALGFPEESIEMVLEQGVCPLWRPEIEDVKTNSVFFELAVTTSRLIGRPLIAPSFVSRITHQLRHPYETIIRKSEPLRTILQFPLLFPPHIHAFAGKLIALDHHTATILLFTHFGFKKEVDFAVRYLTFWASRKTLFEDGLQCCQLLAHRVPVKVAFAGEAGTGNGPSKEFFTEFSRELCRQSRGLFRSTKPGEYCVDPQGMFPRPDADPKHFFALGVLAGRAILANMTLDIVFNPAFFKLVRGIAVELEEVDAVLARSLRTPGAGVGLSFIYPGFENLLLKPGGDDIEVTPESNDEFVRLVTEFTCGRDHLRPIVREFISGYGAVIPLDGLKGFTEEELGNLLTGDLTGLTEDDLRDYMQLGNGYVPDSPQVVWFIELVAAMERDEQKKLLQFATGFSHLPIGGLARLSAPLTLVAKREGDPDSILPTAMTCINYLKMPEYTAKEIMKAKLHIAITIGAGSFQLS